MYVRRTKRFGPRDLFIAEVFPSLDFILVLRTNAAAQFRDNLFMIKLGLAVQPGECL